MNMERVLSAVESLAASFAEDRGTRQQRRSLDAADFDPLREAGYLLTGIPESLGGLFRSTHESTRPYCELLRTLSHGDPAVALVSAMHPAVLVYWMATESAPSPFSDAWAEQRSSIFEGVKNGDLWGTITSEPGSGGDILKTRAVATSTDSPPGYALSGDKHFGSGSGMSQYMLTTALPEGAELPDVFFVNIKDSEWDGSTGVKLIAEWDGHGMAATQSHAFTFDNFPAERAAWPGMVATMAPTAGAFANYLFTAVIFGLLETAMETARESIAKKVDTLRPYEQVEWTRVENDFWLASQAYEGLLRASEQEEGYLLASLRGKTVIAELSESILTRMSKVLGGGTFSRRAPYGTWAQDVRALGFLRPPWGLAYDQLHQLTLG